MAPTTISTEAHTSSRHRPEQGTTSGVVASYRTRLLTGAGVLALSTAAVWPVLVPPPVVPATAPPTAFSAERAMAHVAEIAQRPHPTGSSENVRVRQYLVEQLTALDLSPQVQEATGVGTRFPVAGTVHNIVARIPGTDPGGRAVLLVAHYDGVPASPAAGDDAAGVGAILETARALRAGDPLRNDVILLLTDGEEDGLLGAAAFVDEHPWAERIAVALNFEARGTSGRSLMFETTEGNARIVRAFARHAPHATGSSFMYSIYQRLPNDTDFSEIRRLELQGLNFAFIDGAENYHTPGDNIARLDARSVQHQGHSALEMTRYFGNAELPLPPAGDVAFFNVAGAGLVTYPLGWTLPLLLLAGLGVLGLIAYGHARGRLRLGAVAIGLLGALGTLVVAALLVAALWLGITALHGAMPQGGRPQGSTLYLFALLTLAATIVAAAYRGLRRWAGSLEIVAGALVLWLALAALTAFALPAGSYLFLWPTLIGAAALGIGAAERPGPARAAGFGAAVAAVVTILFIAPLMALVFLGLQLEIPGVIALVMLTGLVMLLLAGQLEALQGRRWWTLPASLGLVALVLVAAGLATVRFDAERPRVNNIIYLLNSDAGEARWISPGGGSDAWTAQFLGGTPEQVELPPVMRPIAWGAGSRPFPQASAPRADLPAPEVTLRSEEVAADGRRLHLRIQAPVGARRLALLADGDAVLHAGVNGRPIAGNQLHSPSGAWRLIYIAPPAEGIELALTVRPGTTLDLVLTAETPGLPELVGFTVRPRPATIMPAHAGDRTLVGRKFRL